MAAPQVLESLGADVDAVLAEAGLTREQFDRPDNLISYESMSRLFVRGMAHTGCPHLGLLVDRQGGLHALGLVGLLVHTSRDVGTALRSLERHFHLRVRGADLILEVDGDTARMGHVVHGEVPATEQIDDGALAEVYNVLRVLCGPDWQPVEIQLARRVPTDIRPYRRFFAAPLRFDADMHAVVFASRWLDRLLPPAEPELQGLLAREIARLENEHGDNFPAQVRSVLRASLATGEISAGNIAALFSMHERTLARRLDAFGTGLRDLLNEARHDAARQMLEGTALDVGHIAELLGYSRASVFTRAFRMWSGAARHPLPGARNASALARSLRVDARKQNGPRGAALLDVVAGACYRSEQSRWTGQTPQ
jgi:AraC-like DNA-binding protein